MRKRGLCSRPVYVLPSLRHVGALVDCINTAEDIVKFGPVAPAITSFLTPSAGTNSNFAPPSAGAQNTQGGENLRFSTKIAIYLRNGTR